MTIFNESKHLIICKCGVVLQWTKYLTISHITVVTCISLNYVKYTGLLSSDIITMHYQM